MVAIIVSGIAVCACALMLGQAVLRVCGAEQWNWTAAPVGVAAEILVAVPALHLPGRATTTAVILGVLTVASAVWVLADPVMRPPLTGVAAGAPVAILTMVPFAAAGHPGILGVSLDNDMATHLLFAEDYRSSLAAAVGALAPDYPIGPHALAATLAQGLGVSVEATFSGLTAAAAVLLAWTALSMTRLARLRRLGQVFVASVAGLPFLVAAYYGQGSFKELLQATFVLGVAGALNAPPPAPSRRRWVPIAVLAAGSLSVYSVDGLPWIVGVIGGFVAITATAAALGRTASVRRLLGLVRAELASVGIALALLAILLVPQIPRLGHFVASDLSINGTFVPVSALGNLVGPLPFWEAFGTWDTADYRVPPTDAFTTGMWTTCVLALAILGLASCIRRREWALPVTAGVAAAIWIASDRSQSPYVAAKGLLILSPIVLLLAARSVMEDDVLSAPKWRFAAPLIAVVLAVKVVGASYQALRFSPVGPTTHLAELRSLRPLLDRKPTLFLGDDDFIAWELAGVPVTAPVVGFQVLPSKQPKQWMPGDALDIDSVQADAINARDWIITTRDAAGSEMPPQLELVRETRDFALWRRTGTVQARDVLPEGDAGGAVLDCSSGLGRGILRGGGRALIRPASSGVGVPGIAPGSGVVTGLKLAPGTYDLGLSYVSAQPVRIRVVGQLTTTMPASLDRPGPRWPIGRVTIAPGQGPLQIQLHEERTLLTPASAGTSPSTIVATPVGGAAVVPVRQACGKYVDWYSPARRP
jgi:uncharacterized integral membrane protein